MALTVEDGTGLAAADSYLSTADADTYHSGLGQSAWVGTPTAKERVLRRATAALDRLYTFVGYRSTKEQALDWPRTGAFDSDDFAIEDDEIPQALLDACAELAMRLLCVDESPDVAAADANTTSQTETAGRVSISKSFGAAGAAAPRFPKVDQILYAITATPDLDRT